MSHRRKTTKKKNPNPPKPRNAAKPKTTKTKNPKNQPKRPKRSPSAAPRKPPRKSPNLTMLKRRPRKRKRKRNLSGRLAAVLLRLPLPTERSRLMLLVKMMMKRWVMLRSLLRRSRSGEGGRRGLPNLSLLWWFVR